LIICRDGSIIEYIYDYVILFYDKDKSFIFTIGIIRLESGHAEVTLALLLVEDGTRWTWPNNLAASVNNFDVITLVPVRFLITGSWGR